MEQRDKEKKITFSEEIDSSISGFALVITFIIVGVFLIFNKNYFGNEMVATIIQWIFIIIGCLGFSTEISNMNKNRGIKGIDNLIIGIVLIIIWAGIYYFIKHWIGNVIGFLFLVIGLYGGCRGIIEIGYSILKKNKKNKEERDKFGVIKEIILMLSEIAGIALIVVQILQAVKVI
jgi:hypothetical protein